jgi:hypothetical protein
MPRCLVHVHLHGKALVFWLVPSTCALSLRTGSTTHQIIRTVPGLPWPFPEISWMIYFILGLSAAIPRPIHLPPPGPYVFRNQQSAPAWYTPIPRPVTLRPSLEDQSFTASISLDGPTSSHTWAYRRLSFATAKHRRDFIAGKLPWHPPPLGLLPKQAARKVY